MTLDEAIKHCEEVAENYEFISKDKEITEITKKGCAECAAEHRQLAEWLRELKQAKELLKKLENTIDDLCNDVSDSPCGCDCCSYVDTINEDECCEVHRLRAEALKLIGEEGEQNAD